MIFKTVDKIIVDMLCSEPTIRVYDLHSKYRLSPAQIIEAAARLSAVQIAELSGLEIRRLPSFSDRLVYFRHAIFNRPMPWKLPRKVRARYSHSPSL